MSDARRIGLNLVGAAAIVVALVWGVDALRSPAARPPKPPERVPVEEAEAFARTVEALLAEADAEAANELFHVDYVIDRAVAGKRVDRRFRRGFEEGAREGDVFGALCARVEAGAAIDLLRVREDGELRAIYRILSDDGLDYVELYIGRVDGEVVAYDLYSYGTGTRVSEAMEQLLSSALQGRELDAASAARTKTNMHELRRAIDGRDGERARRALRGLPPAIRSSRPMALMEVSAAYLIGPDEHRRAIEAFRRRFPDDPALELLLLDSLIEAGQYNDALASVDRIDRAVGGDPWLDVARANIEVERGDLDAAWTHVGKARAAAPALIDVHWNALTIALARKDYPTALAIMSELERDFAIEFEAAWMSEHGVYEGLLASDEWKASAWSSDAR